MPRENVAPVCDFCGSPKVRYAYPALDFTIMEAVPFLAPGACGPIMLGSDGGWAACNPCHHLIERGHWPTLVERTIALMDLPVSMRESVIIVQAAFRVARIGEAVPIPEGVAVEVRP